MADELEPTDAEATAVEEEVVVEAPKPTAKKKSSSVVEEEAVVVEEEPVAVIEEPVNPGGIYEETGLTEAEVKAQAVVPTAQPVAPVTSMIAFSSRKR
jgi:hypothetical protein